MKSSIWTLYRETIKSFYKGFKNKETKAINNNNDIEITFHNICKYN